MPRANTNPSGRVADRLGPLESAFYRNRIQKREDMLLVIAAAVEAWTAWAKGCDYDDSPEPEHITRGRAMLTARPVKQYGCWVMVGWNDNLMMAAMMADGSTDHRWDDMGLEPRRTGESDDDKWLRLVNKALGTTYQYSSNESEYRG